MTTNITAVLGTWMFNVLTIVLVWQTDDMEAVVSCVLVVW